MWMKSNEMKLKERIKATNFLVFNQILTTHDPILITQLRYGHLDFLRF